MTTKEFSTLLQNKLTSEYGVDLSVASNQQIYRALALICRQMMSDNYKKFQSKVIGTGSKQVYYLCMEFLMGRSLKTSLLNLGLDEVCKEALAAADINVDTIYEEEPDAGLGNGGLGRLAACYLDGMATDCVPGTGYSILYEYGIFKQKIVDGWQQETADNWLPGGQVWIKSHPDQAQEIRFDGQAYETWDGGFHHVKYENYNSVIAVPNDMYVAGYGSQGVAKLRLWQAKAPSFDMRSFNAGNYNTAISQSASAELISKILYPNDNHTEGKILRLRQQYFFSAASIADILQNHLNQYGTLENQLQIDYALDRLMDHPTREPVQRDILRMGAYQILFLDRVPDSAAVDEAVKLTRAMGMEAACGFINAVLRNLSRGKDEIAWPDREADPMAYLSVMGSMPLWLVEKLVAAYGPDEAERVILYREEEHPVCVRPNLTRLSDDEFEKLLEEKGWRAERGLAPHAWLVYGAGDLAADADYRAGRFSIQGQSSMLAAEALEVRPGMKVLDACAAPGGKSAYLCEQMQLTGRVYAWELHEKRAQLLEGVRRRLGLDNLRISVRDALDFRPDLEGTLDGVLLDAPCAGLGVLSQKPDIKLRLKQEDIPAIVDTQGRLLDTVCRYVRPGGALVYSTCSLLPEENADRVRAFLETHGNFVLDPLPASFPAELRERQTPFGLQLLGCRDGVEGFFIARMRRVR